MKTNKMEKLAGIIQGSIKMIEGIIETSSKNTFRHLGENPELKMRGRLAISLMERSVLGRTDFRISYVLDAMSVVKKNIFHEFPESEDKPAYSNELEIYVCSQVSLILCQKVADAYTAMISRWDL